eukprot:TRINITY_DN819_c0_g1_i2.p1 TRINITY_DN819_c0_g1~~TRINITY_DN819_c0_g1_i2.p1  ORF type:complete len:351 (+),score=58.25 TRINITY_DN819_c0_g1_i2:55-1107(+)
MYSTAGRRLPFPLLLSPSLTSMVPAVKELYIYPIKSCKGIRVSHAYLSSTGFVWDRQWMVVNEKGRFITQRQVPGMSQIVPSLPPEALEVGSWGTLPSESSMCINAPGMPPLQVSLLLSGKEPMVPAAVWEWSGTAADCGDDAANWFSQYLGRTSRLVRFHPEKSPRRPIIEVFGQGYESSFTDGYPILLISQASLDSLNEKIGTQTLKMNRFRPNILVDGCDAFDEDTWQKFAIADVNGRTFKAVKPCTRCKVTAIDQETAEPKEEPLATLGTFRTAAMLGLPKEVGVKQACFGMNVVYDIEGEDQDPSAGNKNSEVKLKVAEGDSIQIVEKAASAADAVAVAMAVAVA